MSSSGKNLLNLFTCNKKILSIELCAHLKNVNLKELKVLAPDFCSVVWRYESTINLTEITRSDQVSLAQQLSSLGYPVLFHLACRYLSNEEAGIILDKLQEINVRNIFVIQGEQSTENDNDNKSFIYASDLVRFIRSNYGDYFCIGVAGYPGHNNAQDLHYLKDKVYAGADFIITQMVLDAEIFTRFVNECRKIGIQVPIIPGVYIINTYEGLRKMTKFCHVDVPQQVNKALLENVKTPKAIENYGINQCVELVRHLFSAQKMTVMGCHFFSLNNIQLVNIVWNILQATEK